MCRIISSADPLQTRPYGTFSTQVKYDSLGNSVQLSTSPLSASAPRSVDNSMIPDDGATSNYAYHQAPPEYNSIIGDVVPDSSSEDSDNDGDEVLRTHDIRAPLSAAGPHDDLTKTEQQDGLPASSSDKPATSS